MLSENTTRSPERSGLCWWLLGASACSCARWWLIARPAGWQCPLLRAFPSSLSVRPHHSLNGAFGQQNGRITCPADSTLSVPCLTHLSQGRGLKCWMAEGSFTQKWTLCHHLLALELFKTQMIRFFHQPQAGCSYFFPHNGSKWWPKVIKLPKKKKNDKNAPQRSRW